MNGLELAPGAGAPLAALAAVALGIMVAATLTGRWPIWVLGFLVSVLAVATAFLFRDPPRTALFDPDLVLAPADGRVVAVDTAAGAGYLGGPARRVAIRSGLADVHVLRSPVDGVIDYTERSPHAVQVGISTGRIRVLTRHDPDHGRLRVREGQLVDQGQPTGLFPVGGRLEVMVPRSARLRVAVGDRVRAGATVLASVDGAP